MATNETKTTAKPEAPSNPFMAGFPAFDPTQLLADSVARWQAFTEQCAMVEQQVTAHAHTAVAQWAQLAKDAIAYGVQLSAEARRLSIETAKKLGVQA